MDNVRTQPQQIMITPAATTRRRFLATTAAALLAPRVMTAQKSDTQLVIGEGEHRYEVLHNWAQLPDQYTWQTTHNVAVDREGLLYTKIELAAIGAQSNIWWEAGNPPTKVPSITSRK